MTQTRFCVIGSLNVDVFVTTKEFPRPGENVIADDFRIFTGGGKGANQAFALARIGANVSMAGKIGREFYGPDYIDCLNKAGVNCALVGIEDCFPGIGLVAVNEAGENEIYVFPGANGKLDTRYLQENWETVSAHDIFLLQLEIPLESNIYAAQHLREAGKTILFDPAPAQPVPQELLESVDFVTPNKSELENLTQTTVNTPQDVVKASYKLLDLGARAVIAKSGREGAYIIARDTQLHVPGFSVKAVDTTAAGDSFNAGFAYALGEGRSLPDCVVFANAVAALSTTALGAQSAMPSMHEVQSFIAANPAPGITTIN